VEDVGWQTHPERAPLQVARTPPESKVPAQLEASQSMEAGHVVGVLEVEERVVVVVGGCAGVVEVDRVEVVIVVGGVIAEVEVLEVVGVGF
jgi:hypothetical protein